MEFIEFIKDLATYIIIFVIVILIKIYVITPAVVVGDSMKGTVENDDWLLIEKISTSFLTLRRFDVVVVRDSNPRFIVKRIIGIPGDILEYKNNALYINGEHIPEPFLQSGLITEDIAQVTVPAGKYFVLGDNRENSLDSRTMGFIGRDQMEGRVLLRIWPLGEFGLIG